MEGGQVGLQPAAERRPVVSGDDRGGKRLLSPVKTRREAKGLLAVRHEG